jgi:hypothetical protein
MELTAMEALMRHNSRGLVDHDRTTPGHADEPVMDSVRTPGVTVVGAGVLAFVVCVTNFALGDVSGGIAAVIVGLLAFGAGLDWLAMDRRRMRQAEREWFISHPAK